MNKILKEHFSNQYNSKRMSHAFLICNTVLDNLKDDLKEILSDYFFESQIDLFDNSDIYIIRPENDKINKDAILSLQEVFKTKSQLNNNRVYIIDGVEKMNDYAANSLLKFLEEPEEGIYAILITSNLEKVLRTIKSRCQILIVDNDSHFDLSNYDEELVSKAIQFVMSFEQYGAKAIAYIYDFLNKKEEKEIIVKLITIVKYFYYSCFNYLLKKELVGFENFKEKIEYVISKNNESQLINKLLVLNKSENMLEYNLNLNLFLDKLIIDMEGEQSE